MQRASKIFLAGAVVLFLVFAWTRCRRHDNQTDTNTGASVLPPGAAAQVVLNPNSHTATVVTPTGIDTLFVGDHPTSITVDPQGHVKVTSRAFGTEVVPFIGVSYGDKLRLAAGVGLLYYHRWDLNAGLAVAVSGPGRVRAFASMSYNVYHNTHLFLGVDNKLEPIGGLVVRF